AGPRGYIKVWTRHERMQGMVVIGVEDNGPGIPPDKLEKIFEAFYTTKEHGTGLGLTLSRRMVEGHGGKIEVTSRVGEGSCFKVYLPLP
ncbi:ATP-binding protein, partial [Thermanaeromonas sp. C210]|uniref:ATP-binding protein n=1 Tax=Thermanaeromonas sp. C210 TaxID=2731925 RepID=UPI0015635719